VVVNAVAKPASIRYTPSRSWRITCVRSCSGPGVVQVENDGAVGSRLSHRFMSMKPVTSVSMPIGPGCANTASQVLSDVWSDEAGVTNGDVGQRAKPPRSRNAIVDNSNSTATVRARSIVRLGPGRGKDVPSMLTGQAY